MRLVGYILVVTLAAGGCGGARRALGRHPSASTTVSNPATTTSPSAPTTRVVVGALAIRVPAEWHETSVPATPCLDLKAPGVLVGTFADVRNCYMQTTSDGPAVTFASGGPPDPPVPTGVPEARTVNGVMALIATADVLNDGRESEFLALFPDFDGWLRVDVSGGRSKALDAGNAILATIEAVGAPTKHQPVQSFSGLWYVHGATMRIVGRSAVVTVNCGPPCVATETLHLSPVLDGRRLDAVITAIRYVNSNTGRSIANPDTYPGDTPSVDDTSYFEFVAPHLLKEAYVHTSASTEGDFGNPYWCGKGLDESLGYHCGL